LIHSFDSGRSRIDVLHAGEIRHDGGVAFGAIPRETWGDLAPPDARNRIALALRPVLVRTAGKTILVDAGLGAHQNERLKEMFTLRGSGAALDSLEDLGVSPGEVDMVIFTHLHVDHMGGAVRGRRTSFPNADFIVQKGEWASAARTNALTRGSYSKRDLETIEGSGRVVQIDGEAELLPGVRVAVTGGHTPCHQVVVVGSGAETVLLPGDLIPSANHLRLPWIAAVDLNREKSFAQKAAWLERAAAADWRIAFYHEPGTPAGKVILTSAGRYDLEDVRNRTAERQAEN